MRFRFLPAVVLAGSAAAFVAWAANLPVVTARPKPGEPYRFFGNRTVTVPLWIHAPEAERLAIRAEVVQLTSRLSTILSELDVPFTSGAGTEVDLPVALPAVKRETNLELRFRSRRPGDAHWQEAGRVALRVYPADLLDPVRAWAQSHAVRVVEDRGSVMEFLRQQNIPVTSKPHPRSVTLYAGPRALQKQELRPLRDGEAAILFTERETETPHLLIDRTSRGITMRVEMRILDRLATDPLAQKILLELFQRLEEQPSTTEGVVP